MTRSGDEAEHREDEEVLRKYTQCFPSWHSILRNDFSLLFYGLGSKRALLNSFAGAQLSDGAVLLLHGFVPNLKPNQLLRAASALAKGGKGGEGGDSTAECVRGATRRGAAAQQKKLLEEISSRTSCDSLAPIYVVILGIDAPSLRSTEWRGVLSSLAQCPGIHIIASADSVLTTSLFDKASFFHHFRFWPLHVAPGVPFSPAEKAQLPQLVSGLTSTASAHSAQVVLRSLTKNAREVFAVIASAHAEQRDSAQRSDRNEQDEERQRAEAGQVPGLSFAELYRQCRSRFLVTNEAALRAHVREFKDHGLVRLKRRADGTGVHFVGLDGEVLDMLLSRLKSLCE